MSDQKKKILGLEELVSRSQALKYEELDIQGIGTVLVAYIGGKARDQFDALCASRTDKLGNLKNIGGIKKELVSLSVVDADGQLLFEGKNKDKLDQLKGFVIDAIFDKSREINRIGSKAVEAAKKN
jgi:hypothetical protein